MPKKIIYDQYQIVLNTADFVKKKLANAEGGHDWWHIYRVWQIVQKITKTELSDGFIIQLGALLHDIADSKFHNGDETIGPKIAGEFLQSQNVPEDIIMHIKAIIENISFKGGKEKQKFSSLELDVIQDADRLDALGAIGIARAFNYGGFKNREIYNPEIDPNLNMTKEEYKNNTAPTINHFYEKLFLLKDMMNTATGKKMAEERHRFMEEYLKQFYKEWEGGFCQRHPFGGSAQPPSYK
ncbi:MAG: HD domain-containing protein [Melioribacteraceae bacterium]|nr:HD domain-containing protein [Melioribacteraceae bacterium]